MRYAATVVGIRRDREDLSRRINVRIRDMLNDGLLLEVKRLLAQPGGMSHQARQALGYAQLISYVNRELSLEEAVEQIKIQTRQFAKHQRTWFRKYAMTRWVDVSPDELNESVVEKLRASIDAK